MIVGHDVHAGDAQYQSQEQCDALRVCSKHAAESPVGLAMFLPGQDWLELTGGLVHRQTTNRDWPLEQGSHLMIVPFTTPLLHHS